MAEKDDIIFYAAVGIATYFIYKKITAKPQDVTTGANTLPSGNPSIEKSTLNPDNIIFRTETPKYNTSYFIKESDLSESEKRALRYGFYDIEDDKIQYGLGQGLERKSRDIFTNWKLKADKTAKKGMTTIVKTGAVVGKSIITPIVKTGAVVGKAFTPKPNFQTMTQAQKTYKTPILTVPSTASIVTKKIFG